MKCHNFPNRLATVGVLIAASYCSVYNHIFVGAFGAVRYGPARGWSGSQPSRARASRLRSAASPPDLRLFSPSKINLFLRIIRKRPDNFHELGSLFQTTAFGDVLEFTALPEGSERDTMECDMPGVPVDGRNLVLRALVLMREKTGVSGRYFHVNLIKKVPAQGGLGGGSGNAATAMFGANELLGRPATPEQMVEWSGELGSDITFFLSRGSAYCTGRGEILTPVPPFAEPGTGVCIVKPAGGLSTPEVFRALDYSKLSATDPEELLGRFREEGVMTGWENYVNDLEAPAFSVMPALADLKEELVAAGFDRVLMSGSGSSIFCIGKPSEGDTFFERFGARKDVDVFPTYFINRGDGVGDWFEE